MFSGCEVVEEIGNVGNAKLARVACAMKSNELDDPVNIGFLGPIRVLGKANGLPNIV